MLEQEWATVSAGLPCTSALQFEQHRTPQSHVAALHGLRTAPSGIRTDWQVVLHACLLEVLVGCTPVWHWRPARSGGLIGLRSCTARHCHRSTTPYMAATSRRSRLKQRSNQWQAVRLGNAEAGQIIYTVLSAPAGGRAPGLASAGATPTELPPSSSSPTKPLCGDRMPYSQESQSQTNQNCSAGLPCSSGAKIMTDKALTSEDSAAGGPGSAAGVGIALPAAAWISTASLCFRLCSPC